MLRQDRSGDLEEVPEADQPAAEDEECPRCGSDRVRGSQLAQRTKAASMLLGFPRLVEKQNKHRKINDDAVEDVPKEMYPEREV